MRKIAFSLIVLIVAGTITSVAFADKKIELEALVWKRDSVPTFEAWSKEFNKLHSNVTVTYSGIQDYDTQVPARMAAGTLPAVIFIPGGNYGFILPKAGIMMDLTNQKFLGRVKDGILQSQLLNGKIYSLPVDLAAQGVIYNKKVFRSVGVNVPKTWDELFALCEKIQAKGIIPLAVSGGEAWSLGIIGMTVAMPFVYGPDPNFDMNVINGKKHFTGPEWTQTMAMFSRLLKYSNKDRNTLNYELGNQLIATDKAAMEIEGNWVVAAIMSYRKDAELGFFPLPPPPGSTKNAMILGCDTTIGVNAKHEDHEMALQFIEWLTTEKAVNLWTDMNHLFSAMKGSHSDFDAVAVDVQKYADAGVVPFPLVNHMWFLPSVWTDWGQKLQQFVAGNAPGMDSQKALEEFLLEAYKTYRGQD